MHKVPDVVLREWAASNPERNAEQLDSYLKRAAAEEIATLRADLARVTAERDEARAELDRLAPIIIAALLWYRGETAAEEPRNDDGLRAAVEEYLDAAKPGVG